MCHVERKAVAVGTILMAWELGGGLGHVMQLQPLAAGLAAKGHRIVAALKDLSHAKSVFGDSVSCLQAPLRTRKVADPFRPPMTFAHILHTAGFGDADELTALGEAWRNLYRFVRPDVIIFDHSPTALLAARGYSARRIVLGSGFCCPPDTYPFPNLRPWRESDPQRLRQDEDQLLANANQALKSWDQPPIQRIGQLYSEVDETLLLTFKELDHYTHRGAARYWGAWPQRGGKSPQWPPRAGRRIFGYLKPSPSLPALLNLLARLEFPTIVFIDGIPEESQNRFSAPTLVLENEPLDLEQVARECDLAILNGGHGGTVAMLMAGKPIFQIPIYLEQGLLARAVVRLGAGLEAPFNQAEQVTATFQQMLHSDKFRNAAGTFASRYADFDSANQLQIILARVEELIGGFGGVRTVRPVGL
jgi:hypothetical protein